MFFFYRVVRGVFIVIFLFGFYFIYFTDEEIRVYGAVVVGCRVFEELDVGSGRVGRGFFIR